MSEPYRHAACDRALIEDRPDDACEACQNPKAEQCPSCRSFAGVEGGYPCLTCHYDPAPLHQAPDADERVGAIVGTLAEAVSSICPCGHLALRHDSGGCGYRALPHACACRVSVTAALTEALAPTVARLMAQAAEEAVAERLAGVEAVCEKPVTLAHGWAGFRSEFVPLADLRAALHPKETDRG